MRLAVDVRHIEISGIGTYIQEAVPRVIRRLSGVAEVVLLGDPRVLRDYDWTGAPGVSVVRCTSAMYSAAEQWEIPRAIPADTAVLWAPHYAVPFSWRRGLIVTVHDLFHLAMPEYVGGHARWLYARAMFAHVRRRADAILCDSRFTYEEFLRLVGQPRGSISVCHLGVAPKWFNIRPAVSPRDRPYILFVGNVKPHKNLRRLLSAFERISAEVPHDLVILGRREGLITLDPGAESAAVSLGNRVAFTGRVADEVLEQYVAHASVVVLPSRYEGFGLPPLEAMAAGCPTVVSRAGSLPEICGDAAEYCDAEDVADIAAKLGRVLTDAALREELRSRGRKHALTYSWDACADAVARTVVRWRRRSACS